ncbi:HAD family hydrolase [Babesia caballi]|uniref:HAD family hydrolase n=1 Tax=Babesia caballi TaxID=5871 RepID=A0AAV4LSU7_BABCB|nr:HAD family hydrolase [Babesia caballi]
MAQLQTREGYHDCDAHEVGGNVVQLHPEFQGVQLLCYGRPPGHRDPAAALVEQLDLTSNRPPSVLAQIRRAEVANVRPGSQAYVRHVHVPEAVNNLLRHGGPLEQEDRPHDFLPSTELLEIAARELSPDEFLFLLRDDTAPINARHRSHRHPGRSDEVLPQSLLPEGLVLQQQPAQLVAAFQHFVQVALFLAIENVGDHAVHQHVGGRRLDRVQVAHPLPADQRVQPLHVQGISVNFEQHLANAFFHGVQRLGDVWHVMHAQREAALLVLQELKAHRAAVGLVSVDQILLHGRHLRVHQIGTQNRQGTAGLVVFPPGATPRHREEPELLVVAGEGRSQPGCLQQRLTVHGVVPVLHPEVLLGVHRVRLHAGCDQLRLSLGRHLQYGFHIAQGASDHDRQVVQTVEPLVVLTHAVDVRRAQSFKPAPRHHAVPAAPGVQQRHHVELRDGLRAVLACLHLAVHRPGVGPVRRDAVDVGDERLVGQGRAQQVVQVDGQDLQGAFNAGSGNRVHGLVDVRPGVSSHRQGTGGQLVQSAPLRVLGAAQENQVLQRVRQALVVLRPGRNHVEGADDWRLILHQKHP